MQTKFLFGFTLLICLVATSYLFLRNEAELDPQKNKNWWTLAFADSRNEDSLDIAVTNYTTDPNFHYTVLAGTGRITESSFEVMPGERKVILIPVNKTGERITVEVTHGQDQEAETQSIYRQR